MSLPPGRARTGFGPARGVEEGLLGLKLRTLVMAAMSLATAATSARLLRGPLDQLLSLLAAGGGVPAHMPMEHYAGRVSTVALTVLCVSVAGLFAGLSWGAFGRLPMRWAMAPVLLLALLLAALVPSESEWLGLNFVERAIQRGQANIVPGLLAGRPPELRDYGLAQLALRTKDAKSLRSHGLATLQAADALAHGLTPDRDRWAAQMQPAVVHAIDVALHGEPLSEAGMVWHQRPLWWARPEVLRLVGRTLAGVGMLLAALASLRTWDLMRRRVRLITLEANLEPRPPSHARSSPLARPSAVLPQPRAGKPREAPALASPQPPPPSIEWGWILRAVVVCAVPILLLRLAALGIAQL